MIKKTFLAFALLLSASLGLLAEKTAPVATPSNAEAQYQLTYFHGTRRCRSCMTIEAYTKEVFEESFKDKVVFQSVNFDEPQNKHFVQDYKLYSQSVVLRKMMGDKQEKFLVVPNVWELLGDKNSFKTNIKNNVEAFMK